MIELFQHIYRALKPWRIPTRADGMTIDNVALAKLIGRGK